ncbi:MAG: hypothetical protein LUE12_07350 [Ruminococcus sp.]|nr:hypothetical protein [Ruminococcus sp.]
METNENNELSNELELINKLSRRKLNEDEVYIFSVILCDNETDRDNERFSIASLRKLAELFVGKTGIFDHDPKGANQTARIFSTQLLQEPEKRTHSGEVYTYLKAKAYMMRTDKNSDFIKEIDGGIKKEVSVCCSVNHEICSICGEDKKSSSCSHIKGEYYSGKLCEGILDGVTDAYEWSFVAIPAQPNAGVTKSLTSISDGKVSESNENLTKSLERRLEKSKADISKAKDDILTEIIRLGQFCVPAFNPETTRALCANMDIDQLLSFKEQTRKQVKVQTPKSTLAASENYAAKNLKFKMKKGE